MTNTHLEAVAEVLRKHRIERCSVATADYHYQWGRCTGCDFESEYSPIKGVNWDELQADILAAHLSLAVLDALGLEEEWGVAYDDEIVPEEVFDTASEAKKSAAEKCQSCDHCRNALPKHVASHLISPWVRA